MKAILKLILNLVLVISFYGILIASLPFLKGEFIIKDFTSFIANLILFILTFLVKKGKLNIKILVNSILIYIIYSIIAFISYFKYIEIREKLIILAIITIAILIFKYLKKEAKRYGF